MKELVSIIIIFSFIKLSSFGIWNFKEKNFTGFLGVLLLEIAVVFMLATVITDIL